ncbi:MAG: hypothetical protein NXY59_03605 [Aigarchaeota archaeon]|nr:hypothetical protein [Candidatus Pelearchaeum maunauluense]
MSEIKLGQHFPHIRELVERSAVQEYLAEAIKVSFEDLRLGTVSDIVSKVIEAVHRLRLPLIVLDSLDALTRELDEKERLRVEKTLAAIVESSDSTLVIVSENPDITAADYLVDAVIELRDEEFENRRARKIYVEKIRGQAIARRRRLFTLYGGRFTVFKPIQEENLKKIQPSQFKPISHTTTHYSTGSEDFDALLAGGLKKGGSAVFFEIGKTAPTEWHFFILAQIRMNMLAQDGGVVAIPFGGVRPQYINESIKPYLNERDIKERQKTGIFGEHIQDKEYFKLDRSSFKKSMENLRGAIQELRKNGRKPCFLLLGVDKLEHIYPSDEIMKEISEMIIRVREDDDVVVFGSRASSEIKDKISDMCDMHLCVK